MSKDRRHQGLEVRADFWLRSRSSCAIGGLHTVLPSRREGKEWGKNGPESAYFKDS